MSGTRAKARRKARDRVSVQERLAADLAQKAAALGVPPIDLAKLASSGVADLTDEDIWDIVRAYEDHLGIELPAAGGGTCCAGAAIFGPQGCTCWVPVHDLEQQPARPGVPMPAVPVQMCADCAYRPGSPERQGDDSYRGDKDLLDQLVASGEPFWCHAGMRKRVTWRHPSGAEVAGHPGNYDPPITGGVPCKADGTPGNLCSGWLLRRVKEDSKCLTP